MQTDELIAHLADDLTPAPRGQVMRLLTLGLAGGIAGSILLMMLVLKPRPDLTSAMAGGAFWMKFGYVVAIAALGFWIVERQARAGANCEKPLLLLAVPVATLVVAAAVQLSAPQADSAALIMGQSAGVCAILIAMLALPIFAGLLLALRRLAPTRLALAGAGAGLLAGGAGAAVYAFHCPETAAPFVAIWYSAGIALAAGVGALAGPRLLRW